MSFDAVMTAVQTGNADLGISGFSWTAERAENYFISDWYEAGENETEQVVITTAENDGKLTAAENYAGLKVGAQGGSLQELLVKEQLPDAECVLMTDLNDLATALLTGKIDALAVAQGNGESFISANDGKLAESGFQFEIDEKYKNNVVLVQKGNTELLKAINDALAKGPADFADFLRLMEEAGYAVKHGRGGVISFLVPGQERATRLRASTLGDGYDPEDIRPGIPQRIYYFNGIHEIFCTWIHCLPTGNDIIYTQTGKNFIQTFTGTYCHNSQCFVFAFHFDSFISNTETFTLRFHIFNFNII